MHKEYLIEDNGSIKVIDENGDVIKKDMENISNIEDILIKENKIEIINNELKKLNDDVAGLISVVSLSNFMMKMQPILIVLFTLVSSLCGGLIYDDFFQYAIYWGLKGFTISAFIASVTLISYKIIKSKTIKKIKGFESSIEEATKLKETIKQELENAKMHSLNSKLIPEMSHPISLELQTAYEQQQIEKELNKAYENKVNEKMTLTRKK